MPTIGAGAVVGPYAVLEPGARIVAGDANRVVLHCDRGGRELVARGQQRAMELVTKKTLRLYSGRSHPALAEDIAGHLGVPLG